MLTMKSPVMPLAVAAFCLMRVAASAADTDRAKPGAEKDRGIELKRVEAKPIPDFQKTFGLPFESIETLSQRLLSARRKMDPHALALIAVELGSAEEATGKKADLTAATLEKEAVEIARLRRKSAELKAIAALIGDESAAKELRGLSAKAAGEEAEVAARAKSGERDKGVHFVKVFNNTDFPFRVVINGVDCGWIAPNSQQIIPSPWAQFAPFVSVVAFDQFGDVATGLDVQGNHVEFKFFIN